MSTTPGSATSVLDHASGTWRLDPARSSVEFHVRHFYGLMTVKGAFNRYGGTLKLDSPRAVELTIDADSLDTKLAKDRIRASGSSPTRDSAPCSRPPTSRTR